MLNPERNLQRHLCPGRIRLKQIISLCIFLSPWSSMNLFRRPYTFSTDNAKYGSQTMDYLLAMNNLFVLRCRVLTKGKLVLPTPSLTHLFIPDQSILTKKLHPMWTPKGV